MGLKKTIRNFFSKFKLGGWSISYELFNYIRNNLEPGKTILELGSGLGTKRLSKFYRMISIEDNEKYLHKYNSEYIFAPRKNDWYDLEKVKSGLENKNYDMILVDGPFGETCRRGFLENLVIFNTDLPIIFDDTHAEKWRLLAEEVAEKLGKKYSHFPGEEKSFGVIL